MAREFSVESFRMEIFRVFEGLVISCLIANCKYIEDRPEKDGVLTVRKRRLFSVGFRYACKILKYNLLLNS